MATHKQTTSLSRRVRDSIFRGPISPQNDRERRRMAINSLILHLHPPTVPEKTLRLTLTWGLGGTAIVLALVLLVTGVMLMFVYTPSPAQAYKDILALQTEIWFGQLVRNLHHWSGNAMIVVVFLHMLRVFLTGAFRRPREFNWILGVVLLLLTVGANFTGYLLPWDQLAYWAITVGTSLLGYMPLVGKWIQTMILGGPEVSAATLLNFYGLHIAVIPVSMLTMLGFHFWRVRKDGGVVVPPSPDAAAGRRGPRVVTIPNLVMREVTVALVVIAVLLLFAAHIDAPLEELANPNLSPNPAKAPWYFMGIQELLLHFDPLIAILVIPALVLIILVALPYLDTAAEGTGVWFRSAKGRWMSLVAAGISLLITPLWIIADEYLLDLASWLPNLPPFISHGILPCALILGFLTAFGSMLKQVFGATNSETFQATFILLLVSFSILTATGVWFRGPGMALVWP